MNGFDRDGIPIKRKSMNEVYNDGTPWGNGLTYQEIADRFAEEADKQAVHWDKNRDLRYHKLAAALLGRDPKLQGLPLPIFDWSTGTSIEPPTFVGDLTAEDDRRLCVLVDLPLEQWDRLTELERLPFMEKAAKAQPVAEVKKLTTAIINTRDAIPAQSKNVVLEVDLSSLRAKLITSKGEKAFDLPSEGVARWLRVLAEHPNRWFRPGDYQAYDPELNGVKPSDRRRLLAKKWPQLARLIEASKHDGMRFNPGKSS